MSYEIKSYYDGHFATWHEVIKDGVRVPYVGRFPFESDAQLFIDALEGKGKGIDPELRLWAIKELSESADFFKGTCNKERYGKYKKLIKFLKGL